MQGNLACFHHRLTGLRALVGAPLATGGGGTSWIAKVMYVSKAYINELDFLKLKYNLIEFKAAVKSWIAWFNG